MMGKPSLFKSRLAASRSPCACRNCRWVTSAGGIRICAIGTGRIFDGVRPAGDLCDLAMMVLLEAPDKSGQLFAGSVKGIDPLVQLCRVELPIIDQLCPFGEVGGVHNDLRDDPIAVVMMHLADRAISRDIDPRLFGERATVREGDVTRRRNLPGAVSGFGHFADRGD